MLQCIVQVRVKAGKMDYFLRNLAKKVKVKKGLSRGDCVMVETFF